MSTDKKKLAVWKFASCDGCQLSVLDCEDELLTLADQIEIAYFPEATSKVVEGPYDLSLVEGSITTPHDLKRIKQVRSVSKFLVAIGACATAGGIQALRNYKDIKDFIAIVYANPQYIDTLDKSTPLSQHIKVDFELRGCPIDKAQLLELVASYLNHKRPNVKSYSVCVECKLKLNNCVMVSRGQECLGPITHAGCGALCPSYDRGCYGCFGPKENSHSEELVRQLEDMGQAKPDILRLLRSFNGDFPTSI